MSASSPLFPATRWTLLQKLREGTEEQARDALSTLCQAYWLPFYVVARKRGLTQHDAEDVVQGFFLWMMSHETLEAADETRGKLRSYLQTSFENYRTRMWRKSTTLRRGGGVEHVNFCPVSQAEERFLQIAAKGEDVEKLYTQEWGRSVLERSLEALRLKYEKAGDVARFDALMPHVTGSAPTRSGPETAARLGMSFNAFRQTVHRLRCQYRENIERELCRTLDSDDPELIRQEMAELFRAFETD